MSPGAGRSVGSSNESPYGRRAHRAPRIGCLLALVCLAGLVAFAAPASALPGAQISAARYVPAATYPGLQHLHFEYGPIAILPGQNTIEIHPNLLKPNVPGYITRFAPNLIYTKSRKVPRVDVVHLHHGVWLMNGYPTMAAGEEKTTLLLPQGYGYHYNPSDQWLMNYMIHNLTPTATSVKLIYNIDFVPDSTPAAKSIVAAHPLWMDVAGVKAYPVFDAGRGQGTNGRFTFPDQARTSAQRAAIGPAQTSSVTRDITLLATAGHLHPGGLYDDLNVTRNGRKKLVFRSMAKYFEPAGAVSWDVSMTATKPSWKVLVRPGDSISTSTTYDTKNASWYEVMGIMVVWYADGVQPGARDPYTQSVDTTGLLTHGHLPENNNHGGGSFPLPDARTLPDGASATNLSISDYIYGRGDLNGVGKAGRPPVIRAGQALTFTNLDGTPALFTRGAYHTITACQAPCNRSTGIAYPVANGGIQFDSRQLGYGPDGLTAAANTNTWTTPKSLQPGTYTYFCRIHPFMRGAFRVKR